QLSGGQAAAARRGLRGGGQVVPEQPDRDATCLAARRRPDRRQIGAGGPLGPPQPPSRAATAPGARTTGNPGSLPAGVRQFTLPHLSQQGTMTGPARQAIVDRWPAGRAGPKEICVSITRSPDSTRSGAGSGPGWPRGGFRLAGFAVRLTFGAQVLAMLTVLAGALGLPGGAPGLRR